MKILIITPYARDANSFWRCMGPMAYLAKTSNGVITIDTPPENIQLAWDRIAQYDLIFMHRPCRRDDLTVMQIARNCNIPVWVDYDDWLFQLPDWNPHRDSYHNPNLQQLMAHILACADIVSVTTEALAQSLSKLNKQVVIIPNAYRSDLFPFRTKEMPERGVTFCWRGTNTHDGDLLSVKDGMKSLPEKLHVFGQLPYSLQNEMSPESYNLIPHQDAILYWHKLYQLAPKFMVFPLYDLFFNRCKSNIAWIEACHAGAMTIAPDLPEWKHPGAISYKANDPESFKDAVATAMSLTPDEHKIQAELAFDYMKSKYDIGVVNQIRRRVVEAMLSPSFQRNTQSPYDQGVALMAMATLKGDAK